MKHIDIFGGGTFSHIRNHLALAAPAFGTTARILGSRFADQKIPDHEVHLHLTKMANAYTDLVTNEDVSKKVDEIIANPDSHIVIFNVAMCDFDGIIDHRVGDKYGDRLKTSDGMRTLILKPADKVIGKIRAKRKDLFLVAFKTTCGATEQEQYIAGLNLLKQNHCNLVLANDTKTRLNMVIVPEEAKYGVSTNRDETLLELVKITVARSQLKYTRSNVVPGETIKWASEAIPSNLKAVVDHCIKKGAYKPFRGSTAGHFAFKQSDGKIITTKRSTNFNDLEHVGMVEIESLGADNVLAWGAKPSVGGQSQRQIFAEHHGYDCIVHFHSPRLASSSISATPQWPYECGSHECGANTSRNLVGVVNGLKAVYLDHHGPNIVFSSQTPATQVIDFIDQNFDLSQKTGGLVA